MDLQTVLPFQGLGALRFGMAREAVRTALYFAPHTSFRKDISTTNETDAYDQLGLHLYYDDSECLEFIEAFPPSDPTYRDAGLLGRALAEVTARMTALGHIPILDPSGCDFPDVGIALYAPAERIEAVAIYREGYYD